MAIVSMQLDPNAASYTDDQIVAKVNTASATISADKIADGTTNKVYTATEKTKLTGIEAGATADMTSTEVITAINSGSTAITRATALSQDDIGFVKTNPTSGEFKVKNIQRDATGKLDVEYDNVAV